MSKKELGEAVGVTPMAVTHWERASNSPDIETLVKICQLFNVTLNEMYGVEEESPFMKAYRLLPEHERAAVDALVFQLSQHNAPVPVLDQDEQDELAAELTKQYKERPHSQTERAEDSKW
jgi:transcriptional regulator with XRE-family HTH domain